MLEHVLSKYYCCAEHQPPYSNSLSQPTRGVKCVDTLAPGGLICCVVLLYVVPARVWVISLRSVCAKEKNITNFAHLLIVKKSIKFSQKCRTHAFLDSMFTINTQ